MAGSQGETRNAACGRHTKLYLRSVMRHSARYGGMAKTVVNVKKVGGSCNGFDKDETDFIIGNEIRGIGVTGNEGNGGLLTLEKG